MENDFPSDEMTYALRGAIFDVRNELKSGWSEHVYHHALERLLRARGYPVTSKPRRMLVHRGIEIHQFEPDLIVWPSTYEFARLKTALASLGLPFALLVNFGFRQLQIFGVKPE